MIPIVVVALSVLAAERGLRARATFRGVDPQDRPVPRSPGRPRRGTTCPTTKGTGRCETRSCAMSAC